MAAEKAHWFSVEFPELWASGFALSFATGVPSYLPLGGLTGHHLL